MSKGIFSQIKNALLLSLFFFVFISVYRPFGFYDFYDVGGESPTHHLVMLTLIMFGVLTLTRFLFAILYKYSLFLWWHYVIWCFGEATVTALFFGLYTTLYYARAGGIPYFNSVSYCLQVVTLTLVYPYLFSILLRIIANKTYDLENKDLAKEDSMVKFYDEHKRLKLTVASSSIIYVSAEANYIDIHYIEMDKVRSFLLRNSMKSIENTPGTGLVRCHRSYFVNPKYIRVLSRDKEGIISVEFTLDSIGRIPVSKQYYDKLANLL